eukprot:g58004.t1
MVLVFQICRQTTRLLRIPTCLTLEQSQDDSLGSPLSARIQINTKRQGMMIFATQKKLKVNCMMTFATQKKLKGWCGSNGKRAMTSMLVVRVLVLAFQATGSLALLRLLYVVCKWAYASYVASELMPSPPMGSGSWAWLLLDLWCLLETCHFYLASRRARYLAKTQHDSTMSEDERKEMVERIVNCLEAAAKESGCVDPTDGARRIRSRCSTHCPHSILVGWHPGASWEDLSEEEALSWFSWALYNSSFQELHPKQEEGIYSFYQLIQERTGMRFSQLNGMNETDGVPSANHSQSSPSRAMRLNFDEMRWKHRPAFAYLVTHLVWGGFVAPLLMAFHGFEMIQARDLVQEKEDEADNLVGSNSSCIEPSADDESVCAARTVSQLPQEEPGKSDVFYWYCPGQGPLAKSADSQLQSNIVDRADGILFLHGVGVGPAPYLNMLTELRAKTGLPILAIELPHISLRWSECNLKSRSSLIKDIQRLLTAKGMRHVCVIGHSYGTVVATWLFKHPELVQGCCLVDPVSFLLFRSEVTHILYREPVSALQLLMDYFLFKEKHVSATFARNFVWHQNIVWADQLPDQVSVVLSGGDGIVPSDAVREYLLRHGVSVVWLEGVEHAGFLLHQQSMRRVIEAAVAVIGGQAPRGRSNDFAAKKND